MILVILSIPIVLGAVAFGIMYTVSPQTAKGLKQGIGSLFQTRKSRYVYIEYENPRTGKRLKMIGYSLPGNHPEIKNIDGQRRRPLIRGRSDPDDEE